MDYQSFQPDGQNQNQPPQILEDSKTQNLSERLKSYRWQIAIVSGIIITLLFGAYSYLKYANQKSAQEVAPTFTPRVIDETAGWKMYVNTKYSFEFKYPAKYTLDNCGDERVIYTDPLCGSDAPGDMSMSFEKADFVKEISTIEAQYRQGANFTKTTILVDGVSAEQFYTEFNSLELNNGSQLITIFAKDGIVFSVHGYDKVLINQILSTFKFTK